MFKVLEEAISDVGYWRWWAVGDASVVQLEFGGVQIARPAADGGVPTPIGILALRFRGASAFYFLTRKAAEDVPSDWPSRLSAGELESDRVSTAMSYELFSLDDRRIAAAVLSIPHIVEAKIGAGAGIDDWERAPAHVAFWAGQVGAVVLAGELEIVTMDGVLPIEAVPELRDAWWTYWRIYWDRRGTVDALPFDGACEATIPLKA